MIKRIILLSIKTPVYELGYVSLFSRYCANAIVCRICILIIKQLKLGIYTGTFESGDMCRPTTKSTVAFEHRLK